MKTKENDFEEGEYTSCVDALSDWWNGANIQGVAEMQDVEFTIENGKLWMLQTRDGKRTARAAIKIAVDMANEGLIGRKQAVLRVTPQQVDTLLHPQFDPDAKEEARMAEVFCPRASMPHQVQQLA